MQHVFLVNGPHRRFVIELTKGPVVNHCFYFFYIPAGGLDAFKQLLEAIPVDSKMAYVVVQHLNPAHEGNLTEILSRVTKIPIEEITDEVKILPNHIYVMPEGKILTSVDGVLKLTARDSVKTNLVIGIFFISIAVVWESMAVGVVLSGKGPYFYL